MQLRGRCFADFNSICLLFGPLAGYRGLGCYGPSSVRHKSRGPGLTNEHPAPRTALVTGASRRIGRAIRLGLAGAGWQIALHSQTGGSEAEAVRAEIESAGGRAAILRADLGEARAAADLVAECAGALGPLTCLVNNASLFL